MVNKTVSVPANLYAVDYPRRQKEIGFIKHVNVFEIGNHN